MKKTLLHTRILVSSCSTLLVACGQTNTPGESKVKSTDSCTYHAGVGRTLAKIAEDRVKGNTTPGGVCWKFVDDDIESMMAAYGLGTPSRYGVRWPTMAAYEFADSAIARKLSVAKGMQLRYAPEYSDQPANSVPLGSVLIYRPGKCGFNATYGHAEIKTGSNRFVSDYIQYGRSCEPDHVFVPSFGC